MTVPILMISATVCIIVLGILITKGSCNSESPKDDNLLVDSLKLKQLRGYLSEADLFKFTDIPSNFVLMYLGLHLCAYAKSASDSKNNNNQGGIGNLLRIIRTRNYFTGVLGARPLSFVGG